MKKIEFDKVYIEIPDVLKKEQPEIEEEKEPTIVSLSTEELQRRLEEACRECTGAARAWRVAPGFRRYARG